MDDKNNITDKQIIKIMNEMRFSNKEKSKIQTLLDNGKREEAFKYIEKLADDRHRKVSEYLAMIALFGYQFGLFEIDKARKSFDNNRKIKDTLNPIKWSKLTFAQSLVNAKNDLLTGIQKTLKKVDAMDDKSILKSLINNNLGSYKSSLERIIVTETTAQLNYANKVAYKECGITAVRFNATLDKRTSNICRKHDQEIVPIKDAKPGVNIPPLHPHCRSYITPIILPQEGERVAKDKADKKYFYVGGNMDFADYKRKYLD
jgi:SPP1 gp7 family putative phage head morphogenesis protein